MVGLVGVLTLGLAAAAAGLGIRGPSEDSTLLADVAQRATGGDDLFGAFQAATALLLLAAAASAYLAGSGLLEALARGPALLPRRFAVTNRFYAPPWGIASLAAAAALLIALAEGPRAGAREVLRCRGLRELPRSLDGGSPAGMAGWTPPGVHDGRDRCSADRIRTGAEPRKNGSADRARRLDRALARAVAPLGRARTAQRRRPGGALSSGPRAQGQP